MNVSKILLACILASSLILPPHAMAQSHVVSHEELQSAALAATTARQKNRDTVIAFLSTPEAGKALRAARVDANLVKSAAVSLSDEDLARLAARAEQAQADFAAGRLSDRELLWILVGIAALILIIVAVD